MSTTHPVRTVSHGADRFAEDAVEALAAQAPVGLQAKPDNQLAGIDGRTLLHKCARQRGVDPESMSGPDLFMQEALGISSISASGSGFVNTPSSFPNIMAQTTKRIIEKAATQAPVTFPEWAHRLPDADDFDPTSIGGHGVIDRLDDYVDGDPVKQKQMNEESKGWIEVKPKANDILLTWQMVVSSMKFQEFLYQTGQLGMAGPRTLNQEMVRLIADNPTLIDGYSLFDDSNHGNLITSGAGAPSDSQLQAMAAKHSALAPLGSSDPIGVHPEVILVPWALRITAEQAFVTLLNAKGVVVANVEEAQHYFKDRLKVLSDPMLDAFSPTAWYSMVNPTNSGLRSFVYRYLGGTGPTGKPQNYADPQRRALVFGVNFAAGCAITKHRGIVKNPGV